MIYTYKDETYDLTKVTRLYPAAIVEVPGGDSAQVSLEWADMKSDKITITHYVLVFDFDPVGEIPSNRKELICSSKDELFGVMQAVNVFFKK
ncbi:hypothetical protein JHD50_09710 [Sulfurimonas sp. MAG313]|nr:hypothetical protein [Sulfurimonas sp. MAG313]MDF1881574.1 hypothetical protein [Sulfurimonas sp. MAG313]